MGDDQKPNFLQVLGSVFAAFFGVQSSENRERDFKHGNFKVYVVVGILSTIAFLATLFFVVSSVLKSAGT